MIANGFKFLWSEGCKAEKRVAVKVANWLIEKVWEFRKLVGQ